MSMATSFFYIYIDIYIDIYFDIYIDIYITFTNWRSVQSFYWMPFYLLSKVKEVKILEMG